MSLKKRSLSFISQARKYRYRSVFFIAVFWTIIDLLTTLLSKIAHLPGSHNNLFIREFFVFLMSLFMGYLFVFTLRRISRSVPLWVNFVLKSLILLLAAFLMNFLVHFVEEAFINGQSIGNAVNIFVYEAVNIQWLLEKIFYWVVLFIVTQLYIEINEKYSPGVFLDILMGKYTIPKVENRIVMFIDLKDSTPIAEKMGHQQYFLFIREFIYDISMALIEYNGRIYQYVGDEIVVSWMEKKESMTNAVKAIVQARKNIQKKSQYYNNVYHQVPEFHVGIHIGEVTVGEIGVIKKDLAMSGDTMNTAARIRSACNELNQKFIASAAFIRQSNLEEFQSVSLGKIDLKGKKDDIELFGLKI
ncbi:MAG: adenylate/guanylate cyclase domain-containing protein [Ferruginibacter sp.]